MNHLCERQRSSRKGRMGSSRGAVARWRETRHLRRAIFDEPVATPPEAAIRNKRTNPEETANAQTPNPKQTPNGETREKRGRHEVRTAKGATLFALGSATPQRTAMVGSAHPTRAARRRDEIATWRGGAKRAIFDAPVGMTERNEQTANAQTANPKSETRGQTRKKLQTDKQEIRNKRTNG